MDENLDPAGKIGWYQGFGKTEVESEGVGRLKTQNVSIISNQECYENLKEITTTNVDGYNQRVSIQNALYDGVTDQLICTEGIPFERHICRGRGSRKSCRTRSFLSVSSIYSH